ncbi:MAG: acetylglutamate kinase [bacterium]
MEKSLDRAKVLIEALPYIKTFWGQTVVIKYGGAAMVDEDLARAFALDIVLLRFVGMKPVIVHGGGPEITTLMEKLGKGVEFVEGHRVTDAETRDIALMILAGKLNKEIVSLINGQGGKALAVGLSGVDGGLIEAQKLTTTNKIDLGFTGRVAGVNPKIITTLDEAGFIPVIAPLGVDPDGATYNINADLVAGELAASLQANKLIFLTDTRGILKNPEDDDSLISSIRANRISELFEKGYITGGMIPKLRACEHAVQSGVEKAHIIDGRVHHSLLLEIFTDKGIGTQITNR